MLLYSNELKIATACSDNCLISWKYAISEQIFGKESIIFICCLEALIKWEQFLLGVGGLIALMINQWANY